MPVYDQFRNFVAIPNLHAKTIMVNGFLFQTYILVKGFRLFFVENICCYYEGKHLDFRIKILSTDLIIFHLQTP